MKDHRKERAEARKKAEKLVSQMRFWRRLPS